MIYSFTQLHKTDLQRHSENGYVKRLLKYFRLCQTTKGILFLFYRFVFKLIKKKNHIELFGRCKIGPGLYIGHPFCITINPDVIIGKNCNLHKGVTIGQENRGDRKGVPTIGDCVWIGVNASIVGKINVGSDVLIAPNSFVNCDIPSHSVVFGNPCIIKHREGATDGYVNNQCDL